AVIVRDQFNNPVAGVAVTFTPGSGSGSVNPTTPVLTNASGIAALMSWTLGTTAGTNTLTASSNGLAGSPVTFTAQGAAGPATQIAVNAGSGQAATVGTAVATPPSVIVRDHCQGRHAAGHGGGAQRQPGDGHRHGDSRRPEYDAIDGGSGAGDDHGGRGLEHHHSDRAGRQRESDPGCHGDARRQPGDGEH